MRPKCYFAEVHIQREKQTASYYIISILLRGVNFTHLINNTKTKILVLVLKLFVFMEFLSFHNLCALEKRIIFPDLKRV